MSKTILIDMDAIVADLATPWYEAWNKLARERAMARDEEPPKPLTVDDVTAWDVGKVVGTWRIYSVLKTPHLYLRLPPFEKAIEVIKRWNDDCNLTVFFVTASITAPQILADKATWMARHYPFISPKQMFYAYHKHQILGDIFIDDSPKNLANFKTYQPNAKTVTIDYPYNRDVAVDFRADGYRQMDKAWTEIEKYVESLK